MTDNDNKDPQITAEIVREWLDKYGKYTDIACDYRLDDRTLISTVDIAQAYLQQAAELKQLRADHEISESARTALYEDLQALQKKYGKLRAERAVELYEIYRVRGGVNQEFEHTLVDTASSREEADRIVAQYQKLWGNVYHKRKLTDSAQSITDSLVAEMLKNAQETVKPLVEEGRKVEVVGDLLGFRIGDSAQSIKEGE